MAYDDELPKFFGRHQPSASKPKKALSLRSLRRPPPTEAEQAQMRESERARGIKAEIPSWARRRLSEPWLEPPVARLLLTPRPSPLPSLVQMPMPALPTPQKRLGRRRSCL